MGLYRLHRRRSRTPAPPLVADAAATPAKSGRPRDISAEYNAARDLSGRRAAFAVRGLPGPAATRAVTAPHDRRSASSRSEMRAPTTRGVERASRRARPPRSAAGQAQEARAGRCGPRGSVGGHHRRGQVVRTERGPRPGRQDHRGGQQAGRRRGSEAGQGRRRSPTSPTRAPCWLRTRMPGIKSADGNLKVTVSREPDPGADQQHGRLRPRTGDNAENNATIGPTSPTTTRPPPGAPRATSRPPSPASPARPAWASSSRWRKAPPWSRSTYTVTGWKGEVQKITSDGTPKGRDLGLGDSRAGQLDGAARRAAASGSPPWRRYPTATSTAW